MKNWIYKAKLKLEGGGHLEDEGIVHAENEDAAQKKAFSEAEENFIASLDCGVRYLDEDDVDIWVEEMEEGKKYRVNGCEFTGTAPKTSPTGTVWMII